MSVLTINFANAQQNPISDFERLIETQEFEQAEQLSYLILTKLLSVEEIDFAFTERVLKKFFDVFWQHQRYSTVETFSDALLLLQRSQGSDNLSYASALNRHARVKAALAEFVESIKFHTEALELALNHNADAYFVARTLEDLGATLVLTGELVSARRHFEDARKALTNASSEEHPIFLVRIDENLAEIATARGAVEEGLLLRKHIVSLAGSVYDEDSVDHAIALGNLSKSYQTTGDYTRAEATIDHAITILEDDDSEYEATSRDIRARILRATGRFNAALSEHNHSLAILESQFGSQDLRLADILLGRGLALIALGRYSDAQTDLVRSLAIRATHLGKQHPDLALTHANLGTLYHMTSQLDAAQQQYESALNNIEGKFGSSSTLMGTHLNNLAAFHRARKQYPSALTYSQQASTIFLDTLGESHPTYAQARGMEADIISEMNVGLAGASDIADEALSTFEAALGLNDVRLLPILGISASIHTKLGAVQEAERIFRRRVTIAKASLSLTHPDHISALEDYAAALAISGTSSGDGISLEAATRSYAHFQIAIGLRAIRAETTLGRGANAEIAERQGETARLGLFLELSADLAAKGLVDREVIFADTFLAAQVLRASATQTTIRETSLRFAVNDAGLSALIRRRDALMDKWRRTEAEFLSIVTRIDFLDVTKRSENIRSTLLDLEDELVNVNKAIREAAGDRALGLPNEIIIAQSITGILGPDNALVLYAFVDDSVFVWAVASGKKRFLKLPITSTKVTELVAKIRKEMAVGSSISDLNLSANHMLYNALWAPIAEDIADSELVFFLPDGSLAAIPPYIMAIPVDRGQNKSNVSWLGLNPEGPSFVHLPGLAPLIQHERIAPAGGWATPLLGFANPIIDQPGLEALAPLQDTEQELRDLARAAGADRDSVFLQRNASEARLKALNASGALVSAKHLAFATHGVLPGDTQVIQEPALILSSDPEGREDGILTASEIAQLTLNARLVILSACNTAAADGTGDGEILSGLARAFFAAGAQELAVSHWYVSSHATRLLMSKFAEIQSSSPHLSSARALQKAMNWLRTETLSAYAHPRFWAPFVLVGYAHPGKGD